MRKAAALTVALMLVVWGAAPAAGQPMPAGGGADWLQYLLNFLRWLNDQVSRLENIGSVLSESVETWWWYGVQTLSTVLRLDEIRQVLGYVESLMRRLTGLPSRIMSGIRDAVLARARRAADLPPASTAGVYRRVVEAVPVVREAEEGSVAEQVHTLRSVAEAEQAQEQAEKLALELASGTEVSDAVGRALGLADALEAGVRDAQSTRAVLEYIGVGLADQIRSNSVLMGMLSKHVATLAQQNAMTNRELAIAVSLLARQLQQEHEARRARMLGVIEGMQQVGRTVGQTVVSVGESVVDARERMREREATMEEAITPR